jgi:hypothetical protein
MNTWTSGELDKFGAAEEIEVAPLGRDGRPRKAVTIWIVRVGDELYVRSASRIAVQGARYPEQIERLSYR